MLSRLGPLSLFVGVLAFPRLALGCYYNDIGEYVCDDDDDDIDWTTYYGVRVGGGLGVVALIFLITFLAVLYRRRRLRAFNNATYITATPSGNVPPPPVYGQGTWQGNNTYSTPYAPNPGGNGYGYSYAAYPPKAFDQQGQYTPVAPTDNPGYTK